MILKIVKVVQNDTYRVQQSDNADASADQHIPPMVSVVCDPGQGAGSRVCDAEQLDQRDKEDGAMTPVEGPLLEVPLKQKRL